jgi:hypothetical protein
LAPGSFDRQTKRPDPSAKQDGWLGNDDPVRNAFHFYGRFERDLEKIIGHFVFKTNGDRGIKAT